MSARQHDREKPDRLPAHGRTTRHPSEAGDGWSEMPLAAAGVVVAATVALYWPSLGAGFVGDDFMILHRLREMAGVDALRFFRGEFFEFYRPIGFLSHALDWAIGGADPRQFHLTNLLLHTINAVLVLLVGRRLSPQSPAGLIAALLFALHASNNEAVLWMSARFDLLATCFSLAALYCVMRGGAIGAWMGPVLFVPAVLSKESAVALPIAVAAWWAFAQSATTRGAAARLVPWLAGLAFYSVLRHLGGGVSAIGGAARLPKLTAFALAVAIVVLLADGRWVRLRDWARDRRAYAAGVGAALLFVVGLAAALSHGSMGALGREKLSVAGFALFCLASPVLDIGEAAFSDPSSSLYWLGGVIALALAGGAMIWLWRPLVNDNRMWFLAAFLVATLLPISALTDGKRYVYLPSAAFALTVGLSLGELRGRARRVGLFLVSVVLVVSAVQIAAKIRDWIWAGHMTSDGARLVDAALAPQCGTGDVVFLTSPVGVRGVYTHFYYETFEIPRGCTPERFQVLARVVRIDTSVDVRWSGPRTIEIRGYRYEGNFILSRDLRNFDTPLRRERTASVQTPLGEVRARPDGADVVLSLTLAPPIDPDRILFFYYTDGGIRALARGPRV